MGKIRSGAISAMHPPIGKLLYPIAWACLFLLPRFCLQPYDVYLLFLFTFPSSFTSNEIAFFNAKRELLRTFIIPGLSRMRNLVLDKDKQAILHIGDRTDLNYGNRAFYLTY